MSLNPAPEGRNMEIGQFMWCVPPFWRLEFFHTSRPSISLASTVRAAALLKFAELEYDL